MLWPPYMRRPTTRFANCTGIRRWPDSTKTIATIMAMPTMRDDDALEAPGLGEHGLPWAGSRDTTDAKIRIDIPLPTPRWVISSPNHMTSAVPATQVRR